MLVPSSSASFHVLTSVVLISKLEIPLYERMGAEQTIGSNYVGSLWHSHSSTLLEPTILPPGFGIRIPVVVEVNIFTSTVPVVIWTIVEVDEVVEVNRVASMKSMKS